MISKVLLKGIPDFLTPISPANEKNYTIVVLFVDENLSQMLNLRIQVFKCIQFIQTSEEYSSV